MKVYLRNLRISLLEVLLALFLLASIGSIVNAIAGWRASLLVDALLLVVVWRQR